MKSFGTEPVVLSSIPIVVLEMRLVYGTHYDIDHLIMLLIITRLSFIEFYALLYKYTNAY